MIDIHSHILPGIDDGAQDIETSLRAMRAAVAAGITEMVCSSHYLRGQYNNPRAKTAPLVAQLRALAKAENMPLKLHQGAEVMLDSKTAEDIEEFQLHVDDTRYVMVESEINALPVNFLEIFYDIVRRGYKPILAHPERYPAVMAHTSIIEDLIHRNVYMQVNGGSLLGGYGAKVQQTAWKLLERGYAHFLASDTHARSEENILKKAAEAVAERFDDYTAELLTTINPGKMLANEPIDYIYLDFTDKPKVETFWTKARDFLLGR